MSDLVDIDHLIREEIERLQEQNFQATLAAVRQSPMYLAAFPELCGVQQRADLRRLPILDGERLGGLCPPHSSVLRLHPDRGGVVLKSGGTTGKRKVLYQSWPYFLKTMYLAARGLARALPRRPRRIANCFPPGALWGGFLFGHGFTHCLDALAFAIGDKMPQAEMVDLFAEHVIDCLVSPPSFALTFLLSSDIDPSRLAGLETLLYAGEAFRPEQLQDIAARYPRLQVHSLAYSSNETGAIGYQCEHQTGGLHHVHEDQILVEIIDPASGDPSRPGQRGELLVTTLLNDGMPLFRYRIGDAVEEIAEPCRCGSATRVIRLLGRADDAIKICSRGFSLPYFLAQLKSVAPVGEGDLQVVLLKSAGGATRVKVLVNRLRFDRTAAARAQTVLRGHPDFVELSGVQNFGGLEVVSVEFDRFVRQPVTGKVKGFVELAEGQDSWPPEGSVATS